MVNWHLQIPLRRNGITVSEPPGVLSWQCKGEMTSMQGDNIFSTRRCCGRGSEAERVYNKLIIHNSWRKMRMERTGSIL